MRSAVLSAASVLAVFGLVVESATRNEKRGLPYVESPDEGVNTIWFRDGSPLTWYYNYMWNVSAALASIPQSDLEFVPQMWGAGNSNDTSFLSNVTELIEGGRNITHVLGFNQPDGSWGSGGSNLSPADAAKLWVSNFLPLHNKGIKIGLPVVEAHQEPSNWTLPFLSNCSALLRKNSSGLMNCPFDFVPIHVFGNISSLESRVCLFAEAFPNKPIWITEYAGNAHSLDITQKFFNESLGYLDSSDTVQRYAYFGAFRSDLSNIGPNVAMLDPYNRLTDIGSWYLGGNRTGNLPDYSQNSGTGGNTDSNNGSSSACSASHPCGQDSGSYPFVRAVQFLLSCVATALVTLGIVC